MCRMEWSSASVVKRLSARLIDVQPSESSRSEEPQQPPVTGIFWDLSYAAHMSDC